MPPKRLAAGLSVFVNPLVGLVSCGARTSYLRRVPSPIQPKEISRHEAALYLGVSVKTVDRLRAAGELDDFAIGAVVRIEIESIDAFKERQRQARRSRQFASTRLAESVREEDELPIPALARARDERAAA
jgi:excisionase family DNA binding protein